MRIPKKIFFPVLLLVIAGGIFMSQDPGVLAQDDVMGDSRTPAPGQSVLDQMNTGAPKVGEQQANVAGETVTTKQPSDWNLRIPILFHIIGAMLYLFLWLLNILIALGANLTEFILNITNFTDVSVVQIGWGITRGLCNMGFALILLLMAFATVLRIESFGMKRMLIKLVIAALLINFSLVFAGIIIDFAQVLTNYFITSAAGTSTISENLMNGLQISRIYDFGQDQSLWDKIKETILGPTLQMIAEQFMGVILFLGAAFCFFAMAFFLIARIVAIWILLILAPLAWLAMIVPNLPGKLGGAWKEWWAQFFKWVFFAPTYAFFLYLALVIAQNGIGINTKVQVSTANANVYFASSFFKTPMIILQYIVIITILLYGLKFAQEAGITGANTVKGMWDGAKGMGKRWLAEGGKLPGGEWLSKKIGPQRWTKSDSKFAQALGRGFQRAAVTRQRLTSFTVPDVWKRAWAASKGRAENRAFSQPSGALQDILGGKGVLKTLTGDTSGYYQNIERNKLVAQRQNEILTGMPDEKQRTLAALSAKDPIEREALWRSLGATNSINTAQEVLFNRELEKNPKLKEKWQKFSERQNESDNQLDQLDEQWDAGIITQDAYNFRKGRVKEKMDALDIEKKKADPDLGGKAFADVENKYKIGPESFQSLMKEQFGTEANRIGNDIAAMMTNNGNLAYTGTYKFDEKTGKPVEATPEERRAIAAAKFKEWEPQKFWTSAHPDSMFQRSFGVSHTGQIELRVTGLTSNGQVYLENMSGLHYGQMNRAQNRMLSEVVKQDTQKTLKRELPKVSEDLTRKFAEWTGETKKVLSKRIKDESGNSGSEGGNSGGQLT